MHLCGDQHLAEDLAQEAMLRAVRSGTNLSEPRALRVWLLSIVKNLWVDYCRARGRHSNQAIPDSDIIQSQPGPLEQVSQAEEVALTVEALKRLPDRQRHVLHLTACEQLTVSEVAEILQITPEAVRSSLSLARARMRQLLQPEIQAARPLEKSNEDRMK